MEKSAQVDGPRATLAQHKFNKVIVQVPSRDFETFEEVFVKLSQIKIQGTTHTIVNLEFTRFYLHHATNELSHAPAHAHFRTLLWEHVHGLESADDFRDERGRRQIEELVKQFAAWSRQKTYKGLMGPLTPAEVETAKTQHASLKPGSRSESKAALDDHKTAVLKTAIELFAETLYNDQNAQQYIDRLTSSVWLSTKTKADMLAGFLMTLSCLELKLSPGRFAEHGLSRIVTRFVPMNPRARWSFKSAAALTALQVTAQQLELSPDEALTKLQGENLKAVQLAGCRSSFEVFHNNIGRLRDPSLDVNRKKQQRWLAQEDSMIVECAQEAHAIGSTHLHFKSLATALHLKKIGKAAKDAESQGTKQKKRRDRGQENVEPIAPRSSPSVQGHIHIPLAVLFPSNVLEQIKAMGIDDSVSATDAKNILVRKDPDCLDPDNESADSDIEEEIQAQKKTRSSATRTVGILSSGAHSSTSAQAGSSKSRSKKVASVVKPNETLNFMFATQRKIMKEQQSDSNE
ncbi:hypothetical protein OIO90_002241 [Microbotryomycetes sp. JL221]|nr:hypothetical protein OIO90_002241 [Microbotryomycetes sp. JL221]